MPSSSTTRSGAGRRKWRSRPGSRSRSASTTSRPVTCFAPTTPGSPTCATAGGRHSPRSPIASRHSIADSGFNAADLAGLGLPGATVVPLVLPVPSERPSLTRASRPTVVLSVGRIAPNKRLEDLISAFARFQREHDPDASLVLVGSSVGFERYEAELREHVRRVGADHVTFTGRVARAVRDKWYRRATVYASTSVHEGFCAPLVEALSYGIPVVARNAGAVPETVGDAGLSSKAPIRPAFRTRSPRRPRPDTRSALVTAAGRASPGARAGAHRPPAPRGAGAGPWLTRSASRWSSSGTASR